MAAIIRLDTPHASDARRLAAGVLVSSNCTEVSAALVAAGGWGLNARLSIAGAMTRPIPRETAALFGAAAVGTAHARFTAELATAAASWLRQQPDRSATADRDLNAINWRI